MPVCTFSDSSPPAPSVASRPSAGARAYASLYRSVMWPAWERLVRGRRTTRYLALAEAMQWRSPDEVASYQLHALRSLLARAGSRVPYWRELFARLRFRPEDVRRREDLAALPVLTREIVRERYADLVDPSFSAINLKKATSGSTGTPLRFEYCPESESWRQAIRIRGYSWA